MRTTARRLASATAVATLFQFLPGTLEVAWAQNRGNPDWHYVIHPTLWFANVDGHVVFGGVELPVGDDALEGSFAGDVEIGKGRWRGIVSLYMTSLEGRAELEGGPGPPGTLADYDRDDTRVELFGAMEVGSFETTQALEFMAGLRYVRHRLDVAGSGAFTARESWIEPAFGARYYAEMGGSFWGAIDGSIGGFGIGSEISWVLGGTLAVRVAGPVEVTLATRYYQTEYGNSETGYLWDEGITQGWQIGLRWRG